MIFRWLPWLLPLPAVVDQVHAPAALVELADGSLVVVARGCLPPSVVEGERLLYRPARASSPCPVRFAQVPENTEKPGALAPIRRIP